MPMLGHRSRLDTGGCCRRAGVYAAVTSAGAVRSDEVDVAESLGQTSCAL